MIQAALIAALVGFAAWSERERLGSLLSGLRPSPRKPAAPGLHDAVTAIETLRAFAKDQNNPDLDECAVAAGRMLWGDFGNDEGWEVNP